MTVILKKKYIGKYYARFSSYINTKGEVMYVADLNEMVGGEYQLVNIRKINDRKKCQNTYHYYCHKAKKLMEETR